MYYSLEQLLKSVKKSKFDRNQLKLSTQHKNMYMHQKKLEKWRIFSYPFLMKFGQSPVENLVTPTVEVTL